jgi:hypothetical protein
MTFSVSYNETQLALFTVSMHKIKISAFLLLAITVIACKETPVQRSDLDFDVSIKRPTYNSSKPVLLFDEGHNNFHKTDGLYQPFANLVRNDGAVLKRLQHRLTPADLSGVSILLIANAKGTGDLNSNSAFTESECEIIRKWVTDGGSLLLIADHFPFGSAVQNLADRFKIKFQGGMVEDSVNYDSSSRDMSQLEFTKANSLLAEHEITKGINRVVTFTGQSLRCQDSCFSFLTLSSSAFNLQPKTKVIKEGNDTRVEVTYDSPASARGSSQGIAILVGKGKVVALGEAAMLSAQKDRNDNKMGMNHNPDNKQLALNIIHWLASD